MTPRGHVYALITLAATTAGNAMLAGMGQNVLMLVQMPRSAAGTGGVVLAACSMYLVYLLP